jgi:hypothetical protein
MPPQPLPGLQAAHECLHLVTAVQGLSHHVTTRAAGGPEHRSVDHQRVSRAR